MKPSHPLRKTHGAALLAAMLTVTLVATFAAAALWQQWRATDVEAAERARLQSAWVLAGALDWSRLILREDARAGGADHLAEPWAVPLAEARLSSFLAADKNIASDALEGLPEAFMSGQIVDAQSKLNLTNLIGAIAPNSPVVQAWTKLFQILGLPQSELERLLAGIRKARPTGVGGLATAGASATDAAQAPLLPQQLRQLAWFGLRPDTIAALTPYATILPTATPLNINTASAEALAASVPELDLASAKRLVAKRTLGYFDSLAAAKQNLPESNVQFVEGLQSIATNYFEVRGRLRLDKLWVEEHSLLKREGLQLTVVWRERGAGLTSSPGKP